MCDKLLQQPEASEEVIYCLLGDSCVRIIVRTLWSYIKVYLQVLFGGDFLQYLISSAHRNHPTCIQNFVCVSRLSKLPVTKVKTVYSKSGRAKIKFEELATKYSRTTLILDVNKLRLKDAQRNSVHWTFQHALVKEINIEIHFETNCESFHSFIKTRYHSCAEGIWNVYWSIYYNCCTLREGGRSNINHL